MNQLHLGLVWDMWPAELIGGLGKARLFGTKALLTARSENSGNIPIIDGGGQNSKYGW